MRQQRSLTNLLQLGLSTSGYAVSNAFFGEGTGWIDYGGVSCTGSEATIQQCRRSPSSAIDCGSGVVAVKGCCRLDMLSLIALIYCMHAGTHREDVGVVCGSSDPVVRPAGVPCCICFCRPAHACDQVTVIWLPLAAAARLQLEGGAGPASSGRLMIEYSGVWGSVSGRPSACTVHAKLTSG